MHILSETFKSHLTQEITTLATLWRITRQDGIIMGFTNHDQDIVYESITYQAGTGFEGSDLQNRDDLSVNNLEILSFFDSASITIEDLKTGLYDFARVDIFTLNYTDLSQGHLQTMRGTLGQVIYGKYGYQFEMRGLSHHLETNIGRMVTPSCDAVLGDSRCNVNLSNFTFNATVTEVTDHKKFTASSLTQAIGIFKAGQVTFTSGQNNGLKGEIRDFGNGVVTMILPFPKLITVGDNFTIITGCNKSFFTCKKIFNNTINFRGFPAVPGFDQQFKTAGTL